MLKKYSYNTFFFLLVFACLSCEETTDWELTPGQNGHLVVEAILTDQLIQQEIKLSKSFDYLNDSIPIVNDAQVSVIVSEQEIPFFQDSTDPSLYKSEIPFSVLNNLEYELRIDWQGERYEASSFLSDVVPIPQINFRRVGTNTNLLSFNETPFLYNGNQQAMYEMNIDWSSLSTDSITAARLVFYTFSSLEESQIVRPEFENVIFPRGSKVILKKIGLNNDFAEYLRALAIETDWNGGWLYSAPASLPTNISNNGLGFFSTCAVEVDTFIAQ